jgi:dihydrofolate synthase/folylpolyglutamate synthase
MTYKQLLKYLDGLGEMAMRLDLTPTHRMLDLLHHPDRGLRSVIISGTNGKGSAAAFLTSIAKAADLRVGTYTSPHLASPAERIAIDASPIHPEIFARVATELIGTLDRGGIGPVTYFEFLTVMAVLIFLHQRVDLAVFEVGLGGRLDCTNALARIGTITTAIGYDHTAILGKTLAEIAGEKGAIMREGLPAVVVAQPDEAKTALIDCARKSNARLLLQDRDFKTTGDAKAFHFEAGSVSLGPLKLGLRGDHQAQNAAAAVMMALELRKAGLPIHEGALRDGLTSLVHPGRLERWVTKDKKEIWLDVAHNPPAAKQLALFFKNEDLAPLDVVIGVLKDKDWRGILEELAPIARSFTICKPDSPRAWRTEEAEKAVVILQGGSAAIVADKPVEAFKRALETSKRVLCTGSFYTVGAIREGLPSIAKLSSS